jgi:ABC-2 type transport system ATP-binding protein
MIDPVISLNGLRKRFGQTIAADGISMVIGKGEIFGFLGANGAGKTTTMRMLCGLTRPTCGHGAINGLDIWRQRSRVHWQFGYVPQRFSLYAGLTVLENIWFFGCAYRVSAESAHRQAPLGVRSVSESGHKSRQVVRWF